MFCSVLKQYIKTQFRRKEREKNYNLIENRIIIIIISLIVTVYLCIHKHTFC